MTRRVGWVFVAAAVLVVPVRAEAADITPTVIVRVRAIDSLIEDAKYLADLAGQAAAAKDFEAKVRQLPGIDFKKPLGAYGYVSPGITDSGFAVMVPVTGEKPFLDLLGTFGLKPQKDKDGLYAFTVPQVPFPLDFYLRFASGYAYVTVRDKAALAQDALLAPAKIFPPGQNELLALSIRIDQLPEMVRQVGGNLIDLQLPSLLEQKQPGETEAQHQLKVAAGRELGKLATALLKEGREIKLVLDLDRKTHDVSAQFSLDAAANSDLAKALAGLGKMLSPFAGLLTAGDAAASEGMNVAVPESVSKALFAVMDEGLRKDLEREPDAAKKALAMRALKAVEPTIKAGLIQFGGALRGPAASGRFTAVGGLRIQNSAAVDQILRDAVKELPPEVRGMITFDHAKIGATAVHRLVPPKSEVPPEITRVFGDVTLLVAVSPEAIYGAFGDDGMAALKEALALKPGTAPPVQVQASVARLAQLGAAVDPKVEAASKKAFQGTDKAADRVRFSVEGGDALRIRLHAKTPVLKFLFALGQGG